MKTFLIPPCALAAAALAAPAEKSDPSAWPQWRGPTRDGVVTAQQPWPATLEEANFRKQWSVELDEGYASPIVSERLVFTVETVNKESERVRAWNRADGALVWERSWPGAMKVPFFAAKNGSWVRSTPAFDGENLYVGGMRDVLVCLKAETGEERWRVDFVEQRKTPLPTFGFVCSPLVDGDAVYVQAGAAVTKLNRHTGEVLWRSMEDLREMYGSAFSSPVFATLEGKRQLVVQTRADLAGLDPEDGKVLWSYGVKAFRTMNILTPTVMGNGIFTASYGGGSFLFQVSGENGTWSADKAWSNGEEGYMSSPVVLGRHIYLHGRDQKFRCLDWETGKVAWTTDEKFGDYWSLVSNGSLVLALDQTGELIYFRADPARFDLIGRLKVSESPTYAHLAVCGEEVFVRDLKGLTAFRWQGL